MTNFNNIISRLNKSESGIEIDSLIFAAVLDVEVFSEWDGVYLEVLWDRQLTEGEEPPATKLFTEENIPCYTRSLSDAKLLIPNGFYPYDFDWHASFSSLSLVYNGDIIINDIAAETPEIALTLAGLKAIEYLKSKDKQ